MAKSETIDLILNVGKKNRTCVFDPARATLDGELKMTDIASNHLPAIINQLGGMVPGHQIQVATKGNLIRIVHRLSLPEYEEMWKKIKAFSGTQVVSYRRFGELPPDREFHLSDLEMATWLFHIRKHVDVNIFHVVTGKCPTYKQIFEMGYPIKVSIDDQAHPRRDDPKKNVGWLYPDEFDAFLQRQSPDEAHARQYAVKTSA